VYKEKISSRNTIWICIGRRNKVTEGGGYQKRSDWWLIVL